MNLIHGGITTIIIPEEKAQQAEQLRQWAAAGWQVLDGMSRDELAAFEREHVNAAMVDGLTDDHPHVLALDGAREALKRARVALDLAQARARDEQQQRIQHVNAGVHALRKARDHFVAAVAVSRDDDVLNAQPPAPMRTLDTSTASAEELAATVAECERALKEGDMLAEVTTATEAAEAAKDCAMLKTPAAKLIARELRADADKWARRIASLRENLEAARAELDRRRIEHEEREQKRAELSDNLPAVVEALSDRIAELEARG